MANFGRILHMTYKRVKGCYDICPNPDEAWKSPHLWLWIESKADLIASLYGFEKMITPVFEHTEVFTRSSGQASDIISKEMYSFKDKGDRDLSLRPEITAPIVRAYIENNLSQNSSNRLYYFGPCWRYDRAQKGRYRQFYQFGMEIFGIDEPMADVETITMLLSFYRSLGLKNTTLLINSIGDLASRKAFGNALREHLLPNFDSLSEDSKKRLETNPLRILDSKDAKDKKLCEKAPVITDFLSNQSKDHFHQVCQSLSALGIDYTINYSLVRGLDYYCDTVFEIVSNDDLGAQNTLGAGGRYNGLVKQMGGPDIPGIGFATGIERILQSLIAQNAPLPHPRGPQYYFIPLSERSQNFCLKAMTQFRDAGISAMIHQKNFNVKKGLQTASTVGATSVIIVGDEELEKKILRIKHLESREETEHPLSYLNELSI